jgi:hypothetical protein
MTIILILGSLVVLNFLLLKFSCNRTTKKVISEAKPINRPISVPNQSETQELAPTGS